MPVRSAFLCQRGGTSGFAVLAAFEPVFWVPLAGVGASLVGVMVLAAVGVAPAVYAAFTGVWASLRARASGQLHCHMPSQDQGMMSIVLAHNLQPHRIETFKFSTDPDFNEKLRDVVGLYMDPPTNAIVLSVDEKSSVQALERTAPIPPLRPGIPLHQTHDYRRNGTTTLFAALNTLNGKVIERCLPRHRHSEFLEFLEHIDHNVPAKLDIHIIMDNYATHKHPAVKDWFARHPRYYTHFTPTSSSWLNAVERFFSEITNKRIRRGTFRSVRELEKAIKSFVAEHNADAKPFVWTKSARTIPRKIKKCHAIYGSGH